MSILISVAEKKAEQAENLRAFSGVKLLHIKNRVEEILSLIGRGDIFDQYTRHDISHIEKMLEMIDWVIPNETQEVMTHSDWLMLVLSVYFHDMGLLVTKQEFNSRKSNFDFCNYEKKTLNGDYGVDYKEKVLALGNAADRFMYQEFVRSTHAQRISNWIEGSNNLQDNEIDSVLKSIQDLLSYLSVKFRRDLALVCKSHHESDLDNYDKYKTCVFYGDDNNEKVNIHYACIILRTVDLLHITSDRTPSTQYQIINPTDPISIIEWNKQMAVNAVKPTSRRNAEGNIDVSLPKDTVSIVAFFDQPEQAEAFFGLSAYITYMKDEITRNYKCIQNAIRTEATSGYKYPWQYVDDREIEAIGFEPKQLTFTIDQKNILKLLIGHTLYNDSNVVIRELVQNSLDAIKLQNVKERNAGLEKSKGSITIKWDTVRREIEVTDNGTGMTVDEINNFLLKVGASKYQSEEFKKEYTQFSPISRFGIGILTCFMVSDRIDIETRAIEEGTANQISIRSVYGRYLLKKISIDSVSTEIKRHGTKIKLKIRSDVDMTILEESLRKWILMPYCDVSLQIDNHEIFCLQGRTCKNFLRETFEKYGYEIDGKKYDIVEKTKNGITMAYVISYNSLFREWTFLSTDSVNNEISNNIGVCIDGIRIEFNAPGFNSTQIVSIANIVDSNILGIQSNVSRTSIESGETQKVFLSAIYDIYASEVQDQIEKLTHTNYSLFGALYELQFLLNPLISYSSSREERICKPIDKSLMYDKLFEIPCFVLEKSGIVSLLSAKDFMELKEDVVLMDSQFIENVSGLLRFAKTDKSFRDLMTFVDIGKFDDDRLLFVNSNPFNTLHQRALAAREVTRIQVRREFQGVELCYGFKQNIWKSFNLNTRDYYIKKVHLPIDSVPFNGLLEDEIGVYTDTGIYLYEQNDYVKYIKSKECHFDFSTNEGNSLYELFLAITLSKYCLYFSQEDKVISNADNFVSDILRSLRISPRKTTISKLWDLIDKIELFTFISKRRYRIFNPNDWVRGVDNEFKDYLDLD